MILALVLSLSLSGDPLTVLALGDAGDNTAALRSCGNYVTNMHIGQHDAGKFRALIFLGNNFLPTGLNIPIDEVPKKIASTLEPFKLPLEELGRENVHAIPGNHDYYSRYAIEKSVFLGLIKIEEAPIGLSDRGNRREAAIASWSFHYGMPGQAVYPLESGSADSAQFIFVDSALPLRTPSDLWGPGLDSLRRLLNADRARPGIVWRILCLHHPLSSVGEHAGYTVWDDEAQMVTAVTPCDKDSNALSYLRNSLDPEDLCTGRYRAFTDSLRAVIRACGVKIHCALSGHDRSLQILALPVSGPEDPAPGVQIVSGAACDPTLVKFPDPPMVYTSAQLKPSEKGESVPGFVQMRFEKEKVRVVFFNANNGDPLDMGGGKKVFWIEKDGRLIP